MFYVGLGVKQKSQRKHQFTILFQPKNVFFKRSFISEFRSDPPQKKISLFPGDVQKPKPRFGIQTYFFEFLMQKIRFFVFIQKSIERAKLVLCTKF